MKLNYQIFIKAIIAVSITFVMLQRAGAQSSFIPQNLGSSINSSYDEINPVLSPDGKTLYFVRVNHPENTFGSDNSEDIWFSTLQANGIWSNAQRLSSLNIGRYNAILSLSPDGNTALINGVYNKNGTFWKKRGLSVTTKSSGGWTTPKKLKIPRLSKRNRGMKSSGMMTDNGQYIILSFSRNYNSKKSNLFYCVRKENGKYKRPRAMKYLNSKKSDDTPFLLADTKTLYFSSDRNNPGEYDIYKSTRTADVWKSWTDPVRLNDTINSNGWDAYFKTNTKGSWAYFSSTANSLGGADLYKVKIFEENPFVIVSGKVLHAKSKRPITGKPAKIMADGMTTDSVYYNADSATYKIKLPLGKRFTLSAAVESFHGIPVNVDMTHVKEFTRLQQDLLVTPPPYVLLKGKLLIQNTNQTIPSNAKTKIYINGVAADSANIDATHGTYTLKVNHGKAYKISVTANHYEALPTALDLMAVDEYKEIPLDLYVTEEKMATIAGKIIDKKTSKPLLYTIPVSVRVEGMTAVRASIDSIAGTYELKLPLGATYTINASAPNYYPVYEIIDTQNENSNVRIYKDLVIVPIEVGQSIRLNNIFFETGKANLKKESFPELDRVATFLKDNPDIKIEIAGHTDNVGKAATNMNLSHARATAVANYIISKGIPKSAILSKGYGLTKPVASNKTKEGKALNRRVEFTILNK